MSTPSYRDRRKRRVRAIAAVVVISLAAPPLIVAAGALKDLGAGVTLLLLSTVVAIAYVVYAGRASNR